MGARDDTERAWGLDFDPDPEERHQEDYAEDWDLDRLTAGEDISAEEHGFHVEDSAGEPEGLMDRLKDPGRLIHREFKRLVDRDPSLRPHQEDLKQEGWMALHRAADYTPSSPEAYAATVVKNAMLKWLEGRDTLGWDPTGVTMPSGEWAGGYAIKLKKGSTGGRLMYGHRYATTDNGDLEAEYFAGGASGLPVERLPAVIAAKDVELGFCLATGCDKHLGADPRARTCSQRCRKALQKARQNGYTWGEMLVPGGNAARRLLEISEQFHPEILRTKVG